MVEKNNNSGINIGSSVFWLIFIAINLASFVYTALWGYNNENSKVAIMSFIFFMMSIIGIVLSRFEIFNSGTWSDNSFWYVIGFVPYFLISSTTKSVLSVTQNSLLSTVVNVMPQKIQFIAEGFLIPISEELFWMVGIPYITISILKAIGKDKRFQWANNKVLQLVIVVLLCGWSFAEFHVGRASVQFWISAFLFRSVTVGLVYADVLMNVFPKFRLARGFGLGAHMGNNIGDSIKRTGFQQFGNVLSSFPFFITFAIYGLFTIIFLSFFNWIGERLQSRSKSK